MDGFSCAQQPGDEGQPLSTKGRLWNSFIFKLLVKESDLHPQSVRHLHRRIPELQGPPDWTELELLKGMAIPLNMKPRAHPQGERPGGREAPAEKHRPAGGLERWLSLEEHLLLI